MAFSMQPGPSSMVPGTGAGQRVAEGAVAITEEKELIKIYGHNWLLRKSDARRLYICTICTDTAAERTLCEKTSHAVCVRCRTQMEQRKIDKCPSCRGPFADPEKSSFHDCVLRQHQSRILQDIAVIDCAECQAWSGVEDGMKGHAQLCDGSTSAHKRKQRMKRQARLGSPEQHECAWSDAGCRWRGSQEHKQAHDRACDWRPVTCSLDGCAVQLPLCQRQEHEANCEYRPARLGVLHTTVRRVQQLERLHQFYQQPAEDLVALSSSQRLERLQETASVFALLYRAVSDAAPAQVRPLEVERACLWNCGFHAAPERMAAHRADCPRRPQTCRYCPQRVPRLDLSAHMTSCPARPASCPLGCGQSGLSARDLEDGSHARSCAKRSLVCNDCQILLPECSYMFRSRIVEEHKKVCPQRPMSCIWCLDSHPFTRFDEAEARCRIASQTHVPYFEDRPLVHQSGALGPVFVRSQGEDNPVFIRLPRQALVKQRASGTCRNLTCNVRFEWDGMSCAIDFLYGMSRVFRAHFQVFSQTRKCRRIVLASLRQDGGRLLEEYEEVGSPQGRLPFLDFSVGGPRGSKSSTPCITIESLEEADLAAAQDSDFLLHLQVEGRDNR